MLKRIKSYGGEQAKIDNLENLITTTSRFEELPKDTQRSMINMHLSDPSNSDLIDKLSGIAGHPDFRSFDPQLQNEALQRIREYPPTPDQVDNLMGLLKSPGFADVPTNIREHVLDSLSKFEKGQLDPDKLMKVVDAWGYKHLADFHFFNDCDILDIGLFSLRKRLIFEISISRQLNKQGEKNGSNKCSISTRKH